MSPMPDGWSVDVEGTRVVVRVSGRPDDEFYLSVQEARMLKNQLHLAYLIAQRERHADANPDQVGSATRRDVDDDSALQRGGNAPNSSSRAQRRGPGLHEDLSPMPTGWSVQTVGRWVYLEVPASAADGVFQLAHNEALIAGIALIRASERARVLGDAVDDEDDEESRLRQAMDLLRRLNRRSESEFVREAHRQSALAAASGSAAEGQAWVEDTSEFGTGVEVRASEPESDEGDQE